MVTPRIEPAKFVQIARLVDQLVATTDFSAIHARRAAALRVDIDSMVEMLARPSDGDALLLARALGRLSACLASAQGRRQTPSSRRVEGRLTRSFRRIAMMIAASAVLAAVPMAAAAAVTTPAVGATVLNPETNANETVVEVLATGAVRTSLNNVILIANAVNDVFANPAGGDFTVTAVVKDGAGRVIGLTVENDAGVTSDIDVVSPIAAAPDAPAGGALTLPAGASDLNARSDVRRGNGGSGGSTGVLFVSAGSGGGGAKGPTFTSDVGDPTTNVTTVTAGLPGVIAASIGGDGGTGGNGYAGASGASGGSGGAGGDVTLISRFAQISTTGDRAHGVVAQSRSGVGGAGGSGYLSPRGGSGGAGANAGSATAVNYSNITTRGTAAHGVFAQSLGGGAGSGGGSYGLTGDGGSGNRGGSGGLAEAENHGAVTTLGAASYGVSAQSVGGIGGDAGTAVGLVTFTSDGAAGGNGGQARVRAASTSSVTTQGTASYGLFSQSIGGGGGSGGTSVALVSLGSGGGTGGVGGQAQIVADDGSSVTTSGVSAHGLFAQSIGGGGGNGGLGIGVVTFGARGASGGSAGDVTVKSGSSVSVTGAEARGVFAQSVGGGGGSAAGTGGIVSLGGSGSVGGDAGAVAVTTTSASQIHTRGIGGDGVFAQSVGGGGGSGSTSGGVFAMGGSGGGGGDGATVNVSNSGTIQTEGVNARGVFAQSVGGGGGSGGSAYGLAALGASAGPGSTGGLVTVTNTGAITTAGAQANAIQAQSIGGGGGDGGTSGAAFLAIGGSGTSGGGSGLVTVNHGGALFTSGDDASGLFAQSVGGGGGNAGSATTIGAFVGAAIGGIGGSGGAGGDVDINLTQVTALVGGVNQQINPLIVTSGDRSRGLFAQSVGGGGGVGGYTVSVAGSAAGVASAAFAVGLGGSGGNGGSGGATDVIFDGAIQTDADDARGALIQSVGGGGGSGGWNVTGAVALSGKASAGVGVGVGGTGGLGGVGGTAYGAIGGDVLTQGDRATAVTVQSVGGGGGAGGFNVSGAVGGAGVFGGGVAVGLGGAGGGGGAGGSATGLTGGAIETRGDQSDGFLVQSVGGGGGAGAFNVAGSIGIGGTVGVGVAVGLGGAGGSGGDGGAAKGAASGAIRTSGNQSSGMIVQSVGGGGGAGAFNVSGSIGGAGQGGVGLSVGLGGAGGLGGSGGEVDASSVSITTVGDQSGGFLAQSVGGGGGAGGFSIAGALGASSKVGAGISIGLGGSGGGGGTGAQVGASVVGNVMTSGADADAIVAQSIGGGGGSGGLNIAGAVSGGGSGAASVSVGLGGSGGDGGGSGAVKLDVVGIAATGGAGSDGMVAQSIGGGGGSGGFNFAGNLAVSGGSGGTIGVGLGGSGGGGGDGGAVILSATGGFDTNGVQVAAVTQGVLARAIVAQSVGGGGGNGGFNLTGGIAASKAGAGNLGVGVGGGGGDGGDAAAVEANVLGLIATTGDGASGMLVQSVGGGGGNGGFNISGGVAGAKTGSGNILVGVGGYGGDGGNAGSVKAGLTGDTQTQGDDAFGSTFQSLGGGGGNGAFNITGGVSLSLDGPAGNIGIGVGGFGGDGGDGADVDGVITGRITTNGDRSYAALLQSVGGGGGNGGLNVTGGITLASTGTGTLGFGLGGFGGGGGDAGHVYGALDGSVRTSGDEAFGALLQSLGGAGGNGGLNVTGGLSLSAGNNAATTLALGVGGFAGGGGSADAVRGVVTGRYETSGSNADGVIAQSLGGGGGNGGINLSGAVALSAGATGTASVGIGGFGGSGGNAGSVNLVRTGDTSTRGANSDGVIAQSVAGGGGTGAINISGGLSATVSGKGNGFGFGLGGFGGDGGDAGNVSATVTGNVWARGLGADFTAPVETAPSGSAQAYAIPAYRVRADGSNGVLVQSVGGGGGSGGVNVTGGLAISLQQGRAVTLGIGGFGGAGGDAGEAHLTLAAPTADRVQVQSVGDNRYAVAVQSIGGGGGAGALNVSGGIATDGSLTAGIGGFGGAGGLGKAVTAAVDADLFASGNGARAFLVQSVGGGGGAGGINITGGVSASPANEEPSMSFGVGGLGGAGNRSGDVAASQIGQIVVDGVNAHAVVVQSVAGGGGDGGLNVTANAQAGSAVKGLRSRGVAIGLGVGGTGGTGADAGAVVLNSRGDIFVNAVAGPDGTLSAATFSGDSVGVLVQSIGGGGGVGGVSATGVVAPLGQPVAIGVGGSGGSGGDGGSVTVVRGYDGATAAPGVIRTFGDNSDGLIAQSLGGGGGRAGVNATFAMTVGAGANDPVAALISVGGGGAGAGSGDAVSVRHNGDIWTSGRDSDGLIAQSIGGGGGNANFNIGLGALNDAKALNLAVGGATGAAGTGGDVSVDHVGTLVTTGDLSTGIHAQSIGGGGGDTSTDMAIGALAKSSIDITIGRVGGVGGSAGGVAVKTAGVIRTSGTTSDAIVAQSIGGGGGDSSAISGGGTLGTGTGTAANSYTAAMSIGLKGGVGGEGGDVRVETASQIMTTGDESRGVLAQSIGGGGGRGGSASTTVINATVAVTSAVGGAGGVGAISGDVAVTNTGVIVTRGVRSDGILAQAVGGGGGMGGMAYGAAIQVKSPPSGTSRTASVNVGGVGGTGAIGGDLDLLNTGTIATYGVGAYGVRAQSIGGGGGIGGLTMNGRIQYGASDSVDVNIGGFGGDGGYGGAVTVANRGLIYTEGRDAAGISANSIGGGGGDAGLVLDTVLGGSTSGKNSHRFVTNIGGSGGDGGRGGDITVTNTLTSADHSGEIVTRGERAYGIFAQSLGGGGGNGSSVISLTGLATTGESVLISLNTGGWGGTGNTGGAVTVANAGIIDTTGAGAHGVLAQSIGGGGGNGGIAFAGNLLLAASTNVLTRAPLVTVGGFGGDGGDGGDVVVTNTGSLVTRGDLAHGVVAQSIGGGGGNAQMGFGLTPDVGTMILSTGVSALIGNLGGGSGGVGGNVTVNNSGDIAVLGSGSKAIVAQSINGGGGSLTFDFDGITGVTGQSFVPATGPAVTPTPLIEARAGGVGASHMNAGKVTISDTGTYRVLGANGVGEFLQSVGGGGGSLILRAKIVSPTTPTSTAAIPFVFTLGGASGVANLGGDIANVHKGDVFTTGLNSTGSLIQSVGGGGGLGLLQIASADDGLLGPITVTLGGDNGVGEKGGDIVRTQQGGITTVGALSTAALLQSIGGGGGSTGVLLDGVVASTVAVPSRLTTMYASALNRQVVSDAVVRIGLGSTGGADLDGGDVSGVLSGATRTYGDHALGLLAQSIGAGGGEVRLAGVDEAEVRLGGVSGASGAGGAINIGNTGVITTTGVRSHGAMLQSIGGGGGAVFGLSTATPLLSADNSGDGGAIRFTQTGDVVVAGQGSTGVVAQSLGGGGGWIDGVFTGTAGGEGRGGAIDLALSGAVMAIGDDGVAVFAQSLGSQGGSAMNLAINGLVRGGAGTGAGVRFEGGAANTITTSGSLSAVSGLAIEAGAGDDTVRNSGVVIGDINLGAGQNVFRNLTNGTFIAFDTIDLRDSTSANGLFENAGHFRMGLSASLLPLDLAKGDAFSDQDGDRDPALNLLYGARVINQVALDGDFVQTATGDFAFDVAFGPYASDRVDVTGDARVAGTGDITLTWLEDAKAVTLFATGGDGFDQGLTITDTIALDYSVKADTDGIHLSFVSDFGQDFLNANGRALGAHIDSALITGGSGGIGRLAALVGNLRVGQEETYSTIFNALNPEPLVAPLHQQLLSAGSFSNGLFGCPVRSSDKDGCVWVTADRAELNHAGGPDTLSVRSEGARFRGGFERRLDSDWSVAVAVGYDNIDRFNVDTFRAHGQGDAVQLGLGLRRSDTRIGDLGVYITGGWQAIDLERKVSVFEPQVGRSAPESTYVKLGAEVGKSFVAGRLFARPSLGVSAIALHQMAQAESGLGGLGAETLSETQVYGEVTPQLGLGVLVTDRPDTKASVGLNVGGVFRSDDRITAPVRLLGGNPDADPALIGVAIDRNALRVGLGLNVESTRGLAFSLSYEGEFGSQTEAHSAGFTLKARF
ncbi:autotransporter outer membrane beta-barrel domain-containing protein [Brevundimonas sp. G8]|uniref:autotransporter outer membrane beta-barrel domain-containing protein n=1 Tax=Brevundimonas sp. G8 TaxID=1350776 RepID=UPI0012F02519|nr:autotransporter outer membrane beta-barrel domain-containing protein [Brevundimonas sp. G8]VXA90198.1 conserved hypothetical protein [Brevundimonas sp. G8]